MQMHLLCMYIDVMTDFNCSLGLQETTLTEGVPDVPIINNYPAKLLRGYSARLSRIIVLSFNKFLSNTTFRTRKTMVL